MPTSLMDVEFSEEVQEHQSPVLDALMKGISWFGSNVGAIISIAVATLGFWLTRRRREALFMLATVGSLPVIAAAKLIMNRQRPSADLVRVVYEAQFQSFPSGHVTFYTVFFGFLAYLMYRMRSWPTPVRIGIGAFSLLLVFTVPFSRVYLGVHWGTDVLAGFFLGLSLLIGLLVWYNKSGKRNDIPI
ncbi:phosphatase PAP2 family protein [Lewinella sp. JB7]|uniref:phosphatase PAP2 family protein n=1 Tax=Lewinella sp. JB7 TaxID=2962887 RepID=UPI0020C99CD2|nr:phosphatase PAP2 family protein [Lewinella sp. JB7]MCP9234730.1 phosphatase PAP2 family protein [Lewinella sp. JB7]